VGVKVELKLRWKSLYRSIGR